MPHSREHMQKIGAAGGRKSKRAISSEYAKRIRAQAAKVIKSFLRPGATRIQLLCKNGKWGVRHLYKKKVCAVLWFDTQEEAERRYDVDISM